MLCVDEESRGVHVRLDLFRAVVVTNNQIQSTPRNIQVRLIKKVEETWERLLFEKNSYGNLAVDWDKWVADEDEDEEEDMQDMLPPNFDMSSLAGMSEGLGMPDNLENESEAGTDDEDDARADEIEDETIA